MLRPHAAPKLMCAHRGLVFQLFAQITVGRDISERVNGIEPSSSAWKADALAVVLYPHYSLLRKSENRIRLLMHYFIITLGMVITTFTAWYGTCTWCGCVFLCRWGFCIAHPPRASGYTDGQTHAFLSNIFIKVT